MTAPQVLVVEDNERNMKLFRDVLESSGYRTLEATTGERALELAVEHRPDLVLMDIQLPDIDGVEALGRLRADKRTRRCRCSPSPPRRWRATANASWAPASTATLKPVDIADLAATVRRYCEERHSMSDAAARILVVDDVPENVRLLEAVLERTATRSCRRPTATLRSSSPRRRSPTSCCST